MATEGRQSPGSQSGRRGRGDPTASGRFLPPFVQMAGHGRELTPTLWPSGGPGQGSLRDHRAPAGGRAGDEASRRATPLSRAGSGPRRGEAML